MSTLAEKLKHNRKKIGYTQQQVADLLNIDRSTYSYYETGKSLPDIKSVGKLLEIFNVSYEDLLEDDSDISLVADNEPDWNVEYENLSVDEKILIANYRLLTERQRKDVLVKFNKLNEEGTP